MVAGTAEQVIATGLFQQELPDSRSSSSKKCRRLADKMLMLTKNSKTDKISTVDFFTCCVSLIAFSDAESESLPSIETATRCPLVCAANGKCQHCRCDLPSDWHADHIDRWAETHRTNVHEMQALCPKCHYQKTAEENRNMTDAIQLDLFSSQSPKEPLNLRRHQDEFLQICKRIKAGEQIKKILMLVTPGGGKSLIPVIAAANLIPNRNSGNSFHGTIADAICWVVPRLNLQKQAEENFEDGYFKNMLGHQHRIMANNNEPNPCKGMNGYVATYQAIIANPDLHAQ